MTHDNRFVTPDSPAVLPSITNKSLMELAKDEGMVVEHRPVPYSEVASFKEVAACGTAVVMTSIKQIVRGSEVSLCFKVGLVGCNSTQCALFLSSLPRPRLSCVFAVCCC